MRSRKVLRVLHLPMRLDGAEERVLREVADIEGAREDVETIGGDELRERAQHLQVGLLAVLGRPRARLKPYMEICWYMSSEGEMAGHLARSASGA